MNVHPLKTLVAVVVLFGAALFLTLGGCGCSSVKPAAPNSGERFVYPPPNPSGYDQRR